MSTSDTKAGTPDGLPAFAVPGGLVEGAELWLVRHGDTEWSREGRHTGVTDLALTAAGERQARALASVLADVQPALVLTSPLIRARETARLAGLHVDDIDPDLAEWNYGAYEGRTTSEIRTDNPTWSLWHDGCPGGEIPPQVAARADRVLARAAAALATGAVVLVAHGHISRMIAARWIGLGPGGGAHLLLSTAAPSILSAQYGAPVIDRWNLPNPVPAEGT
ncbi:MAG TPA: histidine phosphatase family protein [Jatrophihabitantaceae bacterium]|nr:histidine phosphatase family protein [Jatrophihabitantaceae bacterium]